MTSLAQTQNDFTKSLLDRTVPVPADIRGALDCSTTTFASAELLRSRSMLKRLPTSVKTRPVMPNSFGRPSGLARTWEPF